MNTVTKGKMTKRKKDTVEFGADNIDNTAPIKKILDDLQHKNDQAFALYCQTVRPRKAVKDYHRTFHFTLTGHPLYAFPDDWEGDLNSGYFEPFTYKSLMPKILTPLSNIDKTDPVTDYLKSKKVWKDELNVFHKISARTNIVDKYETLNEEVALCPKHFVDMAAHLDQDPDPYFNNTYNWYYAGQGNMALICINSVDYILHSVLNNLCLTQMISTTKNEFSLSPEYAATYKCDESSKILETICSSNNIITLRTKNTIHILKITNSEDGKIEFVLIKAVESKIPFTSISFDEHHKNILYITNLDGNISIVNLDRLTAKTVKLKERIPSLVDNWSMVIGSDRVTYTNVTKSTISMYDKRTNDICYSWKNVREVTDYYTCNDISAAKLRDSNSLYFATDHHLFLIDLRHHSQSKSKLIQRWTHGMQSVPTYLSIINFECNKKLVCLSSQWCEDTCVVPNYNINLRGQAEIIGVTMPYRLHSILTTLNAAREKLLCCDLYSPIESRLSTSITGQTILEHYQNYVVLLQNSLGDISSTTLYPEHMESFIDDDSVQCLHDWSRLYRLDSKNLEMSSVEDIINVLKELKRVPSSYTLCNSQTGEVNTNYEKETIEVFENEELDNGLLDAWKNSTNEITLGESTMLNLHYSEDDSKLE